MGHTVSQACNRSCGRICGLATGRSLPEEGYELGAANRTSQRRLTERSKRLGPRGQDDGLGTSSSSGSKPCPCRIPGATSREADSLGHSLRGVSPDYCLTTLLKEVEAAGLSRDAAVYEIEPLVIRAKGSDLKCPRDGQIGAAYVDCIHGEDAAGFSTHMLSYTWGYSIGDIAECVNAHCVRSGFDPKRCYFWICCLCINQHRVQSAKAIGATIPFAEFRMHFGETVEGVGRVVAMMAPWRKPGYLTRVWCVFEMFTVINSPHCEISIVMPPQEVADFAATLLAPDTDFDVIWETLASVEVENAVASVAVDRDQILELIRSDEGPGTAVINLQIVKFVQKWFADSVWQQLQLLIQSGGCGDTLAQTCATVAKLFTDLAFYDRALEMYRQGQQLVSSPKSLTNANLLHGLGALKFQKGGLQDAIEHLCRAKEIRQNVNAMDTLEGASLLAELGGVYRSAGELQLAMKTFAQAYQLHDQLGTLDTVEGSKLLIGFGTLKFECGDLDDSEDLYVEAAQIRKQACRMRRNTDASLLVNMGLLCRRQGKIDAALESLNTAMCILYHLGTTHSPTGMSVSHRLGDLLLDVGNTFESLDCFQTAMDVSWSVGLRDTREAAEFTYSIGVALEQLTEKQQIHQILKTYADAPNAFADAKQMYMKLGMSTVEFLQAHVDRQKLRGVTRLDVSDEVLRGIDIDTGPFRAVQALDNVIQPQFSFVQQSTDVVDW